MAPFDDNIGLLVAELKAQLVPPRLRILLIIKKESVNWLNTGMTRAAIERIAWTDYGICISSVIFTVNALLEKKVINKIGKGRYVLSEAGENILKLIKDEFDQAYKVWERIII